jgi:hypothetical protein
LQRAKQGIDEFVGEKRTKQQRRKGRTPGQPGKTAAAEQVRHFPAGDGTDTRGRGKKISRGRRLKTGRLADPLLPWKDFHAKKPPNPMDFFLPPFVWGASPPLLLFGFFSFSCTAVCMSGIWQRREREAFGYLGWNGMGCFSPSLPPNLLISLSSPLSNTGHSFLQCFSA